MTPKEQKEKLLKELIDEAYAYGEKEAVKLFDGYEQFVDTEVEFTALDKKTVLVNLLTKETAEYKKRHNVKNIDIAKLSNINDFMSRNVLCDDNLNLYRDDIEGYRNAIKDQFFTLKKIDYLKSIIKDIDDFSDIKEKIVWLGTPSQLGFLIKELIEKGYIEKADEGKISGKKSVREISKIIYNTFKILDLSGEDETTFDYFYKQCGKSNSLTGSATELFRVKKNPKPKKR